MSNLDFIREHIPRSALWDQLGEELAELIQALYKLRRAEGNGNPTPVTVEEARAAVQEEVTDVTNCLFVLGIDTEFHDWLPVVKGKHEQRSAKIAFTENVTLAALDLAKEIAAYGACFGFASEHGEQIRFNCMKLGYNIDFDPENQKLARWVERIKEAQNG